MKPETAFGITPERLITIDYFNEEVCGFPGINSEILIKSLKNIVISSGSACTSSSVESSYVLSGMGLPKKTIDSSIRIGIGRFTTKSDINHAINIILINTCVESNGHFQIHGLLSFIVTYTKCKKIPII